MKRAEHEAAIRILGAADGYYEALIAVRREIRVLTHQPIKAHHKKRIRERDRQLVPLRLLETFIHKQREECLAEYRNRKAAA